MTPNPPNPLRLDHLNVPNWAGTQANPPKNRPADS